MEFFIQICLQWFVLIIFLCFQIEKEISDTIVYNVW